MGLFGNREPRVTDSLSTADRIHLGAWTIFSVFFGALLGVRLAVSGWNPLLAILGGMILMPLFLLGMMRLILGASGRVGRSLYNPSGSRTPSRSAYSGPESLAVRGRFEEAVQAYEAAAAEEPTDPEPWLRISRIERSDLKRPQRALEALRTARTRTTPDSPTAIMIAREIADILLKDSGEPARAMPELARLAAEHPDNPIGQWAARELAEMKKTVDRSR